MFNREAYNKKIQWFLQDRFGMFIHWGLYAIPARGEWVRSTEQIGVEAYEPFFREFDPVDYAPKAWAKAAKNAGMKYAVLTSKHHDGFCLFDSALTDYKATNTPAGRDLVREFLDAFRAAGLKVPITRTLATATIPSGRTRRSAALRTTLTTTCNICTARSRSSAPNTEKSTCSGSTFPMKT